MRFLLIAEPMIPRPIIPTDMSLCFVTSPKPIPFTRSGLVAAGPEGGQFGAILAAPALRAGLIVDRQRALSQRQRKAARPSLPRPWSASPCGWNRSRRSPSRNPLSCNASATAPPRARSTLGPPDVSANNSTSHAGSRLRWRHSAKASPKLCQKVASGKLIASFMLAPAPIGPTRSTPPTHLFQQRPGARKILFCARPRRRAACRSNAGPTVPPTGHSTIVAPLAATFLAKAISVSGCTVLISMNSLPETFPSSRPDLPSYTLAMAPASVRMVIMVSTRPASSPGLAATAAPAAASALVFSCVRFHITTSCPTSISRLQWRFPFVPIRLHRPSLHSPCYPSSISGVEFRSPHRLRDPSDACAPYWRPASLFRRRPAPTCRNRSDPIRPRRRV